MLVITLVTPMSAVAFTMDALMGPLHVETMNSVLWLSLLILMVGTLIFNLMVYGLSNGLSIKENGVYNPVRLLY
jgi:hypothetical protein